MRPYPARVRFGDFPGEGARRTTLERTSAAEAFVLVRKAKLEAVAWIDVWKAATGRGDGAHPGAGPLETKWVQYKLNELGYVAGPLTGAMNDQTARAIRRYAHAAPGQGDIKADADATALLAKAATGGQTILDDLKASRRPRADLVETPGALVGTAPTRVIVDHGFGFINEGALSASIRGVGEANVDDGHAPNDRKRLDPFEVLLAASVELVSKNDADGTGAGVAAPEATGALSFEWFAYDPPEDLTKIQAAPQPPDALAGKALAFVTKVHTHLGAGTDALDARDNCPVEHGGFRPRDHEAMATFFPEGALAGVWRTRMDGKRALSTASTDPARAALRGKAGTLFRGSFVGGDNYVVVVRPTLAGAVAADKLKAEHRRLGGLAEAFGDDRKIDPLAARTGKMTVWRRHHVAEDLVWGTAGQAPITWAPVVAMFNEAHVILAPPNASHTIDQLVAPNAVKLKQDYIDLLYSLPKDSWPIIKAFPGEKFKNEYVAKDQAAFKSNWLYPQDYPARKQGETPAAHWTRIDQINLRRNWLGMASLGYRAIARWLRDTAGVEHGLLIVRARYFPPVPGDVARPDPPYDVGASKGDDWGVVWLEEEQYKLYSEPFLVGHELGHCFYLAHAGGAAVKTADHDTADRNCAMHYPEQVDDGRRNAGWGLRATSTGAAPTAVPSFCGKCLLKLRGWKVMALPGSS